MMEGLQKIAVRFYNESSEAEKQKIDEIFREVDSDGDGKVTFKELKDSGLFTNELSTILDLFGQEERNGILDFDEFVILFLHMFEPVIQILGKYLPGSRNCDVCGRRQGLADFSCFFCLGKSPDSYDMCYDCHESGAYSDHEHGEEWCILNHESLALLEFFRHGLVSAHFVQVRRSCCLLIKYEKNRIHRTFRFAHSRFLPHIQYKFDLVFTILSKIIFIQINNTVVNEFS